MIIVELLQREFLLQEQQTCGYQLQAALFLAKKQKSKTKRIQQSNKISYSVRNAYLVLFL